MRKRGNYSKFPESLRKEIVHLYYTTESSFRSLEREFNVSRSTIDKWVKKSKANYETEHGLQQEIRTFASANNQISTMPQTKLTPQEMEKRIKDLEKELEFERMRAITYDTMINVAENMFKIPIRKKPGAKQFKK